MIVVLLCSFIVGGIGDSLNASTPLPETSTFINHVDDKDNISDNWTIFDVSEFLHRYGYLTTVLNSSSLMKNENENDKETTFSTALKKFQEFYNLQETGEINKETLNLMQKPRCGVQDYPSDFSIINKDSKWTKNWIGWKFQKGAVMDEYITDIAFKIWELQSNLRFYKTNNDNPDILISFKSYNHTFKSICMGASMCPFKLDGIGYVLAHSYFPSKSLCREIHLDLNEKWHKTLQLPAPSGFTSLYLTLIHEIGHVLGLYHSSVENALMYSMYDSGRNNAILDRDDIYAIQSVYGIPRKIPQSPSRTTTTTVKSTTFRSLATTPAKEKIIKHISKT